MQVKAMLCFMRFLADPADALPTAAALHAVVPDAAPQPDELWLGPDQLPAVTLLTIVSLHSGILFRGEVLPLYRVGVGTHLSSQDRALHHTVIDSSVHNTHVMCCNT